MPGPELFTQALLEFLGTFVFLSVIYTQGSAVAIGVALAAVIFFGGAISGGHFNPAVTLMSALSGKSDAIHPIAALVYILSQILGGLAVIGFQKLPMPLKA